MKEEQSPTAITSRLDLLGMPYESLLGWSNVMRFGWIQFQFRGDVVPIGVPQSLVMSSEEVRLSWILIDGTPSSDYVKAIGVENFYVSIMGFKKEDGTVTVMDLMLHKEGG